MSVTSLTLSVVSGCENCERRRRRCSACRRDVSDDSSDVSDDSGDVSGTYSWGTNGPIFIPEAVEGREAALRKAAVEGDLATLTRLLEEGVDVDAGVSAALPDRPQPPAPPLALRPRRPPPPAAPPRHHLRSPPRLRSTA